MDWENITYDELYDLYVNQNMSDERIADIFNVFDRKVSYKRKTFGITFAQCVFNSLASKSVDILDSVNNQVKKNLLEKDNINDISIALTHYLFRSGPVEGMHSSGQLSDDDMKTLNKYMANKMRYTA